MQSVYLSNDPYDAWDRATLLLCQVGHRGNKLIEEWYFKSEYTDFLFSDAFVVKEFKKLVNYRTRYWLHNSAVHEQADVWLNEMKNVVEISLRLGNLLVLLKEYVWTKYSTLPLLQKLQANVAKKLQISSIIIQMQQLLGIAEKRISQPKNFLRQEIISIEHRRLSSDTVKKMGVQRFLNIYQIRHISLKKKGYFAKRLKLGI